MTMCSSPGLCAVVEITGRPSARTTSTTIAESGIPGFGFVAWGALHGLLLTGHKLMPQWQWRRSPAFRPLAVLTTLLAVCIGWVFFRAQTFGDAFHHRQRL